MTVKDDIRAAHRARRKAMDPAALDAAGEGIARHGMVWAAALPGTDPKTFAVYLGVGKEPPTLPLIKALHGAGHRVLLPVCEDDRQLSWVLWTPATAFHRSRFAPIDEPDGERLDSSVVASADGIFLPATAVDGSGSRIGQGGGYYDRLLERLDGEGTRPPSIAVVFSEEVLPAGTIPAESFDQPVPAALTPDGEVRFSVTGVTEAGEPGSRQ
ncbi:5-formyltetrahydrofolate cyclo-ligase [Arthrobacter sp. SW1]|uniref:5-formyltetrahydrofolate cyclo-ligase n=1 Tax=Arthrobacter sp. SW1 TaxID=1920889 RepID=UPI000877DA44|nr:5-formyltetrahydrofolate cyclo-ligase [Arthrobacter sp. SW1]OFI40101.1 5-formyltetrahydrofolate cyclo-ligase [Arthrobacter sp. SW1]